MVEKIKDWNGKEIEITKSRASKVIATLNPFDNIIRTGISPWPTPELIQKLYKSRQQSAFDNDQWYLGYYSDIQSVNSEDAMVWSVFGTIIYSSKIEQMNFVKSLFRLFKLNDIINSCNIWLWRRIPHPDTLVSGGPEIDFGIQTDNALILGEAKWKSGVDKYQGKDKKKSQIQLREEFISKYVTKMYESSTQIEMCMQVTLNKTDISVNNISWADIVELPHPLKDEIKRYYDWKYLNCNL